MHYQGQGQLSHHLAESGPELRMQMTATAAPLRAYARMGVAHIQERATHVQEEPGTCRGTKTTRTRLVLSPRQCRQERPHSPLREGCSSAKRGRWTAATDALTARSTIGDILWKAKDKGAVKLLEEEPGEFMIFDFVHADGQTNRNGSA